MVSEERTVPQQSEQVEPDTGEQNLRVDEAGAQIEESPRVAVRGPANERKPGRPALKAGEATSRLRRASQRSRQP
ncbi:hypothetical protein GCM10025880_58360 [Methylorubrum aminovorans]|nr:hypothetical protein GCM10025880_58360 [Methylorubrum aminovorans]